MTQVTFNKNGILTLGAISREEDLNPRARIIVNGPPSDGRCEVCGRHMSELTPFGGPGDPLVGDFTGELLVKTFRWDFPPNVEADKAWDEAVKACKEAGKSGDRFEDLIAWEGEGFGHIPPENIEAYEKLAEDETKWLLSWFIDRYGEEKGERIYYYNEHRPGTSKSWECRDCIVLDGDEYFQKREQTQEKEKVEALKRFDELAKEKGLTEKDKQLFDKFIEDKAVDRKIPVYFVKILAVNYFEDFWKGWEIYKQGEQKKT
jgi:hypothetical protein